MKKDSKKYIIYLLSFILPVIIFFGCCAFLGIFPFGEKATLVSDMLVQYSSFFLFYKRMFAEGLSVFYSFGAGCGTTILDLFSYYLASPFNLILLFFSEANITEAIFTLILIKLGFSGITFSMFLVKKFHKNDISVVVFSLCYSLMAYAVVYFYNVMWLDALIWLPLIILGIERIFSRKKPLLFYGTLAIAIFSNWYIGWMLCIFSGIYALYIVFRNKFNKKLLKSRIKSFFYVCLYGVLAALTCAFILFPVFCELNDHEKTYMGEEKVNFEVFDLFSKFFVGGSDFLQITSEVNEGFENLPAIYCGLTVIMLAIMYFFNSKIRKQEKIASVAVLIIGFLSFYIQSFNSIWHGFNGNVWYPYRYSFVFSFFLIVLSYRCWLRVDGVDKRKLKKMLVVIACVIIIVEKFNYSYIQRTNTVLTVSCFIAICTTFYFILYKKYKMIAAFVVIVIFEILVNTLISIAPYNFYSRNLWYNMQKISKEAVDSIQDDGFYRILVDDELLYNSGLINGHNSINYSSSTVKTSFTEFLKNCEGAQDFYNHCLVCPDMPVRDMLLSNKYTVTFNEDYSKYDLAKQDHALSIGFLADEEIKNFDYKDDENAFEFQNRVARTILGREISCFNKIEYKEKSLENIIAKKDGYEILGDYAVISYVIPNIEGKMYMQFFDFAADVYVDGKEIERGVYNRQIVLLNGDNEDIEVKVVIKAKGKYDLKEPVFYTLDELSFNDVYEELLRDELKLEKISDVYLSGEVVKNDEKKILFVSIPYNKGWTAKVNGVEQEILTVFKTFSAIEIPNGICNVELCYFPYGLKNGAIFSVFSTFLAIILRKKLK